MRNMTKNIVQIWGKAVHKSSTTCAKSEALCTHYGPAPKAHGYNSRHNSRTFTLLQAQVIHRFFAKFSSVRDLVIPTMHRTYKENNKSKILNSYIINREPSL